MTLDDLPIFEYLFMKKFVSDVDQLKLSLGNSHDLPYESMLDSNLNVYGHPTSPRRYLSNALVERSRKWHEGVGATVNDPQHPVLRVVLFFEALCFTGASTHGIPLMSVIELMDECVSGTL